MSAKAHASSRTMIVSAEAALLALPSKEALKPFP
jgi:hypothetical protein